MAYYSAAYSSRETINNTKHYARQILDSNIPGVLVECGVAGGAQLGAMRDVIGTQRWIYGFDSFEGIPIASDNDDQQPGIVGDKPNVPYNNLTELLRSSGVTVHGLNSVRNNLNAWTNNKSDNIVLVKGWFQNTLAGYVSVFKQMGGISLLRLDGDLYESTKVSLEHLFPLVNEGGIIIIDDWALTGCRKACQEYFIDHPVCEIEAPYATEGPAYFVKGSGPALAETRDLIVVQIGTNNGNDHVLRLCKQQTPAEIYLVEPMSIHNADITNNYAGISNVTIENIAITPTKQDDVLMFYTEQDGPTANSSKSYEVASIIPDHLIKHDYDPEQLKSFPVKAMTMNEFFISHSLKRVDYLFLDIEGIDFEVLESIDFSSVDIRKIQIEHLHLDKSKLITFMEELGYVASCGLDAYGYDTMFTKTD